MGNDPPSCARVTVHGRKTASASSRVRSGSQLCRRDNAWWCRCGRSRSLFGVERICHRPRADPRQGHLHHRRRRKPPVARIQPVHPQSPHPDHHVRAARTPESPPSSLHQLTAPNGHDLREPLANPPLAQRDVIRIAASRNLCRQPRSPPRDQPQTTVSSTSRRSFDDDTVRAAKKCGIKRIVLWNVVADYENLVTAGSGGTLHAGDIVLMHYLDSLPRSLDIVLRAARKAGLKPALLRDYLTQGAT